MANAHEQPNIEIVEPVEPAQVRLQDASGLDQPFFAGGQAAEFDAVMFNKTEATPDVMLRKVLGHIGILPANPVVEAAIEGRIDWVSAQTSEYQWPRGGSRSMVRAPEALLELRERTENFNETPLLSFVQRIMRQSDNGRNQQLEFMARSLIDAEVEITD